jgi:hypothetical protein
MKPAIKTGFILGTAAAINVELGWSPTYVIVTQSDGLLRTEAWLSWTVPFTSAGTAVPVGGSTIKGVTSNARATVKEVMLTSGTYAAGTGAGFFVLEEGSLTGTFGSENIVITNLASGALGTDDATVTANVVRNVAIAAAASPATRAVQPSTPRASPSARRCRQRGNCCPSPPSAKTPERNGNALCFTARHRRSTGSHCSRR